MSDSPLRSGQSQHITVRCQPHSTQTPASHCGLCNNRTATTSSTSSGGCGRFLYRGGFGELKRSSPHAGNCTRSVPGVIEKATRRAISISPGCIHSCTSYIHTFVVDAFFSSRRLYSLFPLCNKDFPKTPYRLFQRLSAFSPANPRSFCCSFPPFFYKGKPAASRSSIVFNMPACLSLWLERCSSLNCTM